MDRMPRNALTAWIAWWVLRRRFRRSHHPLAPVGVAGLEFLGPRLFLVRRLFLLLAVLTIVGLVVVVTVWWMLRRGGGDAADETTAGADEAGDDAEAADVFVPVDEPATRTDA